MSQNKDYSELEKKYKDLIRQYRQGHGGHRTKREIIDIFESTTKRISKQQEISPTMAKTYLRAVVGLGVDLQKDLLRESTLYRFSISSTKNNANHTGRSFIEEYGAEKVEIGNKMTIDELFEQYAQGDISQDQLNEYIKHFKEQNKKWKENQESSYYKDKHGSSDELQDLFDLE